MTAPQPTPRGPRPATGRVSTWLVLVILSVAAMFWFGITQEGWLEPGGRLSGAGDRAASLSGDGPVAERGGDSTAEGARPDAPAKGRRDPRSYAEREDARRRAVETAAAAWAQLGAPASGQGGSSEVEDDALSIAGTVVDDRGAPLPGVTVSARLAGMGGTALSAVSDGLGLFSFSPVEEGEYDLAVEPPRGYRPTQRRVRAGIEQAELRLQRIAEVKIQGRVLDHQGRPLAEAEVRALGASAASRTAGDGRYSIRANLTKFDQPPVLDVRRVGFRDARQRVPEALEPGNEAVEVDIRMEPGNPLVSLIGFVTGPRGEPVAGARVWVSSAEPRASLRATTAADGQFLFEEVEIGDAYRLGVDPPEDYQRHVSESFPIGPDDSRYDVPLERRDFASLSGVIIDPLGQPLPGFSLWLRSLSQASGSTLPVYTDGAGQFELDSVPAGEVKFESRSQPSFVIDGLNLAPGQARFVEIPVDWGPHWLLGRVVDADGHPVSQARVLVQWSRAADGLRSRSRRETQSDLEGYFSFSNLGPGVHSVSVSAGGLSPAELQHDPRSGQELTVRLRPLAGMGGG